MGMVFQSGALFDSETIEDNIMFPLKMFTDQTKEEMLDRVSVVLKRVNLENVNKKYPAELSGGMQKRVAIARAIVMNPKYLFCDEPNSGLDPRTAIIIDNLIKEITDEYQMITVINTHDMTSLYPKQAGCLGVYVTILLDSSTPMTNKFLDLLQFMVKYCW